MSARSEQGRTAAIEALHAALASENLRTRCHAVRALARLGARDKATRERFIGLLLDPDADVRIEAAQALGRLKVRQAVSALRNNLQHDPDGDVRIETANALGRIGAKEAVAPLIDCLRNDGYPQLDGPGDELEFAPSYEVQSRCLEALGVLKDARAVDAVIALLDNEDYEHLQEAGYRVLARLNSGRATAYLLNRLRDGERLARRRAATALGDLPSRRGRGNQPPQAPVNGLLAALGDGDPGVRVGAARALGHLRPRRAVVSLTHLLRDSDREVRETAAAVLGETRGRAVVHRLHEWLADPDSKMRRAVVPILGNIGNPGSVKPLQGLLKSADDNLRYAAVRAIESIAEKSRIGVSTLTPVLHPLAALLDDRSNDAGTRLAAADALGRLLAGAQRTKKFKHCLAVLERAVHDTRKDIAFAALNALRRIEPKRACTRLVALLAETGREKPGAETIRTDESPTNGALTAAEAAQAFGYAPGADASNATLTAIAADVAATSGKWGQSRDSDPTFRPTFSLHLARYAARLLGGLKRPGAKVLRALQAAFDRADTELRREVLLALGRIGDARALPTILKGLAAPEPEIRLTAIDALGRLKNWGQSRDSDPNFFLAQLLDDNDPAVRERAVQTLDRHNPRRLPTRHWRRLLSDEDISVCRTALNTLSRTTADGDTATMVVDTMFRHAGELRHEAAAALHRLGRAPATARLLSLLNNPTHDELHWICIDGLAELHAKPPVHPGAWGSR